MTDSHSIYKIIAQIQPDEIYNLAAQSFVGVSWTEPEVTGNINALGVTRLLEAIHHLCPDAKFYQASTSELFGNTTESPQNENTVFKPRSPYGISKLYAHWTTINYRESYDMFCCCGILYNHETIASFMPMFCKSVNEEEFDIKPICEIVEFDQSKKYYQSKKVSGIQIWDKNDWVDVTFASAYPHNIEKDNKYPRFINSRSGAFMATANHVVFMKNNLEKRVEDINVGDCLELVELPQLSYKNKSQSLISKEEAELMGMMVADGSITYSKKSISVHGKFTKSSDKLRKRFSYLWSKVTGGSTAYYPSKSGFNPENIVGQLILVGGNDWLRKIDIYNNDKTKRIPKIIFNSSPDIMLAFLRGYNICDGLKKNRCTYEFKNFKTNSPTLAMGLWYLIDKTTNQDINLSLEIKDDGRIFYSLNILSTVDNVAKEKIVKDLLSKQVSQRGISRETGISRKFIRKIQRGGHCYEIHHLRKNPIEVKKIIDSSEYDGWFYDLETSSGSFHCGIGKCHVHNSPRRGVEFVTQKIVTGVANIHNGSTEKIKLGNIDAKRDWGYAPDYVDAMYKILRYKKPMDFVIATGEQHTVRDFVKEAFEVIDVTNYNKYIEIDPKLYRPADVNNLAGDYSTANKLLGWKPKTSFKELVKIMVETAIEKL